jgi:glutathione S-transferase
MKLYYKPGSASFVVHWLLLELGAPFELQLVDLSTGEQRSPAYLKLNPNGTVPTLEVDGEVYYETAAILLWLADRDPKQRFAPAINEHAARGHYLKWMLHLANTYMPTMRLWWYPAEGAGEANIDASKEVVAARMAGILDRLDTHLAANGPYLLGDRFTAADLYLCMLMRWTRNMPRPATNWPALARHAGLLRARPSFKLLNEREQLTEWLG